MTFIYFYEETLKVVQKKYPSVITQARFKLFWAYFALLDRILQQKDIRRFRNIVNCAVPEEKYDKNS